MRNRRHPILTAKSGTEANGGTDVVRKAKRMRGCKHAIDGAAVLFTFSNKRRSSSEPGLCSGVLLRLRDEFVIAEKPEHICIFSGEAERKIFAICAEGRQCEVEGMLDDCKGSGECSQITDVVSVRDATLAKQQDQPPLRTRPASPEPFEMAKIPTEIRVEIEAVVRTCKSPVTVLGDFSSYLVDNNDRFLVFHSEKIRCDDLTAICKTMGCLHQLYISKDNRPYWLERSTYVSEIELKYLEGKVAVVITSSERTRIPDGTAEVSIEDAGVALSAFGTKPTFQCRRSISAFGGKADMANRCIRPPPSAVLRATLVLRDVQCPRCNGHGRPHIIAFSQRPSI